MNFLVTGGAGFIGSHVCERLLSQGHAVWAFDELNDFYAPAIKERNVAELKSRGGQFTLVQGDLTNRTQVEAAISSVKFDQIIHLAARAGVRPSLEEPALYQRVNVEGTVNVFEAARKQAADPALAAMAAEMAAEEGVHIAWVKSAIRRTPNPVVDWNAIFG